MKTSKGEIVLRVFPSRAEDLPVGHLCQLETSDGYILGCIYPSLTDPGTLGCLLALVAEVYGVTLDDVHVVRTTGMVWSVWIFRADGSSYRPATHESSRAEALVAALEAAQ